MSRKAMSLSFRRTAQSTLRGRQLGPKWVSRRLFIHYLLQIPPLKTELPRSEPNNLLQAPKYQNFSQVPIVRFIIPSPFDQVKKLPLTILWSNIFSTPKESDSDTFSTLSLFRGKDPSTLSPSAFRYFERSRKLLSQLGSTLSLDVYKGFRLQHSNSSSLILRTF
jgi:hypothetical protein